MGYLVDSNVLIDYIAERFSESELELLDTIFDDGLNISVITKIEILGFNISPEEERRMAEFLDYANILQLTDDIVDATISLKKSIKIKTPDAIIASTALISGLTLITSNTSDFKRIAGLKLFRPHE